MFTNNSMIWQMEDRGSHHEPAYHDHKEAMKWHSHYGHHTMDMIQWTHQNNKIPWNRRSHHGLACPPFTPSQ